MIPRILPSKQNSTYLKLQTSQDRYWNNSFKRQYPIPEIFAIMILLTFYEQLQTYRNNNYSFMEDRAARQEKINPHITINSIILMQETLKLPMDQENGLQRIGQMILNITNAQRDIFKNIKQLSQVNQEHQSIKQNCAFLRKMIGKTPLPQILANQKTLLNQFMNSMVLFNDLYQVPKQIQHLGKRLKSYIERSQNCNKKVIKRNYDSEKLIEYVAEIYQKQNNTEQFLRSSKYEEVKLLEEQLYLLKNRLIGQFEFDNILYEVQNTQYRQDYQGTYEQQNRQYQQNQQNIEDSSDIQFNNQIYLRSMMKKIQRQSSLCGLLQQFPYLYNIWKFASLSISSDTQPQTFQHLMKNIDINRNFCLAMTKAFQQQDKQRFEHARQQNFLIGYQINAEIVQSALKLSQQLFKNIMSQTIQSNQQFSQSLLAFLQLCLNSNQGTLPGYFVAQICKDKVTMKLFCIKKPQSYSKQKRQKIYSSKNLTLIGKVDQQRNSRIGRVRAEEYFIEEVQYSLQGNYQFDWKKLINMVNQILKLSKELQIKAVIIGDSQKVANKHFLSRDYNNHYVSQRQQRPIQGFRKNIYLFCPMLKYGGQYYYPPKGWLRYGLVVAKNRQQFDEKYRNWPVAYHGAPRGAIISILCNGYRSATGFESWDYPATYFTPSIVYAGMYAEPFQLVRTGKWVQIVLQVRINPSIIARRVRHSLGKKFEDGSDPNFIEKPNQYEWIVKGKANIAKFAQNRYFKSGYQKNYCMKDGVVTYGIMMKLTDSKPNWRKS